MKRTYIFGLIFGAAVVLSLGIGGTYFAMKQVQETLASLLLYEAHEHAKKNEIDRAIAKLNQSVGLNPYNDLAHLALGETYERMGQLSLALEEYQITKGLCIDCYGLDQRIESLTKKVQEHAVRK